MTSQSASIAFLHTSPVHVATFDRLLANALPGRPVVHLVDESLLADARRSGLNGDVAARVQRRLAELANKSPALVVCTCSTIGPLAESAPSTSPVLRVDRPMAKAALALASRDGGTIGVAAALESTIAPTLALLADAAATQHLPGTTEVIPCFEAWPAFERGDTAAYGRAVAGAIRPVADRYAVIVLAQASMAAARPYLTGLAVPVLDSPTLLVDAIVRQLGEA
ncbi:MAG: aspartate/glutamate racemase family protein [Thermomicrobiales bacterium]